MKRRFSLMGWAAMAVAGTVILAQAASAQSFNRVIAFGDSLTDRGNTIALMGQELVDMTDYDSTYYNGTYNQWGTPSEGRYSNGPTWVEYLNGMVMNSSSTPADLGRNDGFFNVTGTNYAWAGSMSGTGSRFDLLPNLHTQINSFSYSTFLPDASQTLFTVWSGGNDAISWVDRTIGGDSSTPDLNTATSTAAANVASAVERLYNYGGRTIVVPNLPALGFKPNFIDTPSELLANSFAQEFNLKLGNLLDGLNLEGLNLIQLDIYALFEDLLSDPSSYGFSNVRDSAFVLDPNDPDGDWIAPDYDQYVFWDQTHPSTRVHEIIGGMAFAAIPEPSVYVLLFAGAALGLRHLRLRKKAA